MANAEGEKEGYEINWPLIGRILMEKEEKKRKIKEKKEIGISQWLRVSQ